MDLGIDVFLAQVFQSVQGFGGMSFMMKISTLILILVASMKVSFIRSFVWDKLGAFKALAAPILSLIVGIISLVSVGPFSWSGLIAYLFAGAGAIILHEILDSVKALPGIGPIYLKAIDLIQGLLKKKA